jgi:hypothetical protein
MNQIKLSELVANIDKSEKNKIVADLTEFAEEFSIYNTSDYSRFENHVVGYWIQKWYCTDTYVGIAVYFFNDDFLCVTRQDGRKCDVDYYFANDDILKKFYDFLRTFDENNPLLGKILIDKDIEFDKYYQIHYTSEILHNEGIYNDEICFINRQQQDRGNIINKSVNITLKDGSQKTVDVNEIYFRISIA